MNHELHHEPVMLHEVVSFLRPQSGGLYCDGTAGAGGHSRALLEGATPDGRLVALDRDPEAVERLLQVLAPYGERATVVHERFGALPEVMRQRQLPRLDGLLVDLGISSYQLDDPRRGLSFAQDGPLDMRLDASQGETARDLVERLPEAELAQVIRDFGEERRARRVARALKRALNEGGLHTTHEAASAVRRAVGTPRSGKIDAATRTFQALRIAVNDELGELKSLLDALPDLLAEGGRAVFISFHSLEDRSVKRALKYWSSCRCALRAPRCTCGGPLLRVVTKKPVTAAAAEVEQNPRARSAKLRVAERPASESEPKEVLWQ
jgi:16S rRNA (cytosine1402-N4)-methyltransferase